MKRSLFSALAAAILLATPAIADLSIATGKAGGGYDKRAREIGQRLAMRDETVSVTNMNGSDEISLALCANRADLGLMQIDALYTRAQEGCTLRPVADYGSEVAVLLFPPKSKIDALDELTASSTVMVDTIGSGSELFWRTIVAIENGEDGTKDEWAKAQVNTDPLELAGAAGGFGSVSALLLVRKPTSPDITRLLDLGWTMGELWDRDINDLQFNGQALYESAQTRIEDSAGKRHKDYTYTVRSFVVATPAVADGDRARFGKIAAASQ